MSKYLQAEIASEDGQYNIDEDLYVTRQATKSDKYDMSQKHPADTPEKIRQLVGDVQDADEQQDLQGPMAKQRGRMQQFIECDDYGMPQGNVSLVYSRTSENQPQTEMGQDSLLMRTQYPNPYGYMNLNLYNNNMPERMGWWWTPQTRQEVQLVKEEHGTGEKRRKVNYVPKKRAAHMKAKKLKKYRDNIKRINKIKATKAKQSKERARQQKQEREAAEREARRRAKEEIKEQAWENFFRRKGIFEQSERDKYRK